MHGDGRDREMYWYHPITQDGRACRSRPGAQEAWGVEGVPAREQARGLRGLGIRGLDRPGCYRVAWSAS